VKGPAGATIAAVPLARSLKLAQQSRTVWGDLLRQTLPHLHDTNQIFAEIGRIIL
jgi:hypothetical protein